MVGGFCLLIPGCSREGRVIPGEVAGVAHTLQINVNGFPLMAPG